jgi:hypothetical protein
LVLPVLLVVIVLPVILVVVVIFQITGGDEGALKL